MLKVPNLGSNEHQRRSSVVFSGRKLFNVNYLFRFNH